METTDDMGAAKPEPPRGAPASADGLVAARYRAVLHAVQDSVMVFAPDGTLLDLNESGFWERARRLGLRGRDLSELVTTCDLRELDGGLVPLEEQPVARLLRGEPVAESVLRARLLADGSESVLSFCGELVRDAQGRPTLAVLVTRDLTRRWRAEEQLAAERERLPSILRSIGDAEVTAGASPGARAGLEGPVAADGSAACDEAEKQRAALGLQAGEDKFRGLVEQSLTGIYLLQDGKFSYVNPRFAEIFGYRSPSEIINTLAIADLVAPESRLLVAAKINARLTGVEEQIRYSFTGLRRDGAKIEVEVHGRAISHHGRPAVIGAIVDNTEARRLEEHLRQTQKLDSIGRLAGGIAHDFGNLLTVIFSSLDALKEDAEAGRAASMAELDQVVAAAEKGRSLTQQLLAFSRKQGAEPREIDLGALVESSAALLRRVLGPGVTLRVETGPGLWRVFADPSQMEQVVMNLAVNGRDAMAEGGTLTFTTRNVPAGALPAQAGLQARDHVCLSVRDTGSGMTPAVLAHLFEPFFTTKAAGRGTGLGLATVHGIVRGADGALRVESEPGKGSCFHVWLPRAR